MLKLNGKTGKTEYSNLLLIKPPGIKDSDLPDIYYRMRLSIVIDKNDDLLLAGCYYQDESDYDCDYAVSNIHPIHLYDDGKLIEFVKQSTKMKRKMPVWNVPGFLCKFNQTGKIVYINGFKSRDNLNTLNFSQLVPFPDGKLVMMGTLSSKKPYVSYEYGKTHYQDTTFIQCNFSEKGIISKTVDVRNFFSSGIYSMWFLPYQEGLIGLIEFVSEDRNLYFTQAPLSLQKLIFFRNIPGSKSSDFNVEKDMSKNYKIELTYPEIKFDSLPQSDQNNQILGGIKEK